MLQQERDWIESVKSRCIELQLVPTCDDPLRIAWLAGLIEGEGSFMNSHGTPQVSIQMVDEDVIEASRSIVGANKRNPWQSKLGNRRLVYHWVLSGTTAISWMLTLYPYMGTRRKSKIKEIVDWWIVKGHPRAPRGIRWPSNCHPEKPRAANGLCKTCYMRQYRRKRREQKSAVAA